MNITSSVHVLFPRKLAIYVVLASITKRCFQQSVVPSAEAQMVYICVFFQGCGNRIKAGVLLKCVTCADAGVKSRISFDQGAEKVLTAKSKSIN